MTAPGRIGLSVVWLYGTVGFQPLMMLGGADKRVSVRLSAKRALV